MSLEEKDSRHEIDSRWFYLFLSSLQCLLSNEKKETAVLALNEMVEVDEGRDWFEFSHRRPSQSNRILLVGGQPGKGGYYLVDLKKRSEEELNRPYCVDFLELSPSRPESKWEDIQKLFSRLGRYVNWPELQSIQSEEVYRIEKGMVANLDGGGKLFLRRSKDFCPTFPGVTSQACVLLMIHLAWGVGNPSFLKSIGKENLRF